MAASGSVMNASKTIFKHEEHGMVFLTLTNTSGVTLKVGDEVNLELDLGIEKRDAGTDFPIGVITIGGVDGARVTVATIFHRTIQAIAKGGTINTGSFVKPNGVRNAVDLPEYVVTVAAGDYVSGVVIKGGAVDTEIQIGMLRSPFKI